MERKLPTLVCVAIVVSLTIAPTAAADTTQEGTTSTGDVDNYGRWVATGAYACPAIYTTWQVTLTLDDPLPGDRVLLESQGTLDDAADAAVATYDEPAVDVVVDGGGCIPPTDVVGLTVSGDLGYEVAFAMGHGH